MFKNINLMKQFLFSVVLLSFFYSGLLAQNLVSTEPMLKNALLEEFTGIYCTNCPVAHREAKSILEDNPGRVFLIALHVTSFAAPNGGDPDFRTPFGTEIYNQSGSPGVPRGTVNRHVFAGGATQLNASMWRDKCAMIIQQMSPVNIEAASIYNATTRTLTITIELYYTADAPASSNFINVALIQDSIYGPQSNGGAGNNYLHMHMLRHLVTGQWGDEVTTTTQGTLVTRTYTYQLPEDYNNIPTVADNMKVVAFVAEGHQEVYTATQVDIISSMTAIDASVNSLKSGQNYPNPASDYTYINVNEASKGGRIEVYNTNGQIVASQSIGNSVLVRLDLSNLSEGMYIYKVVSGNITSEARKLTVIR